MTGRPAAASSASATLLNAARGSPRRRGKEKRCRHCEHQHSVSYHSSSNSESNIDSPRLSDGERSSSTPTSIDESAAAVPQKHLSERNPTTPIVDTKQMRALSIGGSVNTRNQSQPQPEEEQDRVVEEEQEQQQQKQKQQQQQQQQQQQIPVDGLKRNYQLVFLDERKDHRMHGKEEQILDNEILIHTDSYIHGDDDGAVLLNKRISRGSNRKSRQQQQPEQVRKSMPFLAQHHSQVLPVDDEKRPSNAMSNKSMPSLVGQNAPKPSATNKMASTSYTSLPPNIQGSSAGLLKRSESATAEIKKMRVSLLHKREMRKKRKSFLMDDDRVLVGNRVSEGHVNFIIAYNMLTGIRVAVSRCSGIMKPLTPSDFKFTKKLAFDYHGNELTPSSQYAFKFKDYCPEVFRELRCLFGLDPADYLVSLTSKYILSELNSPGKSGSFFYYSRDYKFIIKTIHHTEHIHLRRHLNEYYMHVKENPDTLVCQFYGLHRVKMPISFQNKVKHRKIYFLVMNNLLPPNLTMHATYDLKGSTWGRVTKINPQRAHDETYRPVLKDLNFLDQEERIKLGPLRKKKFLEQLRKDTVFLAKLNTMDYSLLLGIHDMNKSEELASGDTASLEGAHALVPSGTVGGSTSMDTPAAVRSSRVFPHYFKQFEGGIRSSDAFNVDTNLIYYVGIIDCLTNYSIIKKLETFWRGLSHDLRVVSAVPPRDYAERFYEFIEDAVDPLPPKRYKDDPTAKKYND